MDTHTRQIASDEEWEEYLRRAKQMFSVPAHVEMHVVVGNHDVGFPRQLHQTNIE
jgi:metallophosphoesterase superfamily enzyme